MTENSAYEIARMLLWVTEEGEQEENSIKMRIALGISLTFQDSVALTKAFALSSSNKKFSKYFLDVICFSRHHLRGSGVTKEDVSNASRHCAAIGSSVRPRK